MRKACCVTLTLLLTVMAARAGDKVIVRTAKEAKPYRYRYLGAEELSQSDDKIKVKVGTDEPKTEEVLATDVCAVPNGEKPELAEGDWVLVLSYGDWVLRAVESVGNKAVAVVDPYTDDKAQVPFNEVLVPPDEWADGIDADGQLAGKLGEINQVKAPPVGVGKAVKAGDTVLFSEDDESWYEAKVKKVMEGKYRIVKMGSEGEQEETEVEAAHVAPAPDEKSAPEVEVGEMVRYRFFYFANYIPWVPGRVDRVEGDTLRLTLSSGETADASPGSWVRLRQ